MHLIASGVALAAVACDVGPGESPNRDECLPLSFAALDVAVWRMTVTWMANPMLSSAWSRSGCADGYSLCVGVAKLLG